MDLNRLQKLAGLPLTESKIVSEAISAKTEIHASSKMVGQLGDVIVLHGGGKALEALAKMLGIPDGWKKVKVKTGIWAAYDGDRLTFFNKELDFHFPDDDNE
jgi:hypothetical protein